MPFITDATSTLHTPIIRALAGDLVGDCIPVALQLIADGAPFAYFDHQGVIVTVDTQSTFDSAFEDWYRKTRTLYNALECK